MKVKVMKNKRIILRNGLGSFDIFSKDALWAYHPCVIEDKGTYYMFYTGKSLAKGIAHHILLATSQDLEAWEKHNKTPIIENGKGKAWDSDFLAHSFVFKDGEKYLMLYDGSKKSHWLEEIGLAESMDLINWKKYKNNPIFKVGNNWWENRHVSRCCIYKEKGVYYLYYAGHDVQRERIGLAKGRNVLGLKRFLNEPVLDVGKKGDWDERSISDPRVLRYKGKYLMFYSGIDASGIERLGLAESSDLVRWKKYPKNPILDVSRADIKRIGNSFYIFYSGKKRFLYNIGKARLSLYE